MKSKSLSQNYQIEVTHSGLTVEKYLKDILHISGRKCQKLTRLKGGIQLNKKNTFLKKQLKTNDILSIRILADTDYGVTPEEGSVEIVYEDEDMIILNKPPFKLVHPTGNTSANTLANHLAYHFKKNGVVCTIRPIHRLDRDTSGCVVFAKNAESQTSLEQQLKENKLKRRYISVVTGTIIPPDGAVDLPIAKDKTSPNRRIVHPSGLPSTTFYQTLKTNDDKTTLELELKTGRTHQIRVHLAAIGHPIIGDKMYGTPSTAIARQALHAAKVSFFHLKTKEMITVSAPLPEDIAALLKG